MNRREEAQPPEGLLDIMLTCPRMSGYAGPAWPGFCKVSAGVCGKLEHWKVLPFELGEEDVDGYVSERDLKRYARARAMEDIRQWRMSLKIPMASGWPVESLDILVERVDRDLRRTPGLVVTRGGPHTSRHTAVIGRARVQLLDALVIGDLDDEEEEAAEDSKKRRGRDERGEGHHSRVEGTVEFAQTVPLLDWELPAMRDTDGNPRSVVRGTVDVRMCLRRLV